MQCYFNFFFNFSFTIYIFSSKKQNPFWERNFLEKVLLNNRAPNFNNILWPMKRVTQRSPWLRGNDTLSPRPSWEHAWTAMRVSTILIASKTSRWMISNVVLRVQISSNFDIYLRYLAVDAAGSLFYALRFELELIATSGAAYGYSITKWWGGWVYSMTLV